VLGFIGLLLVVWIALIVIGAVLFLITSLFGFARGRR